MRFIKGSRLSITDSVTFKQPELIESALDRLNDAAEQGPVALIAKVLATASGVLINDRVYPGTKVKASVGDWCDKKHGGTAEFNKPILTHHQSGGGLFSSAGDPIGRVEGSEYIQMRKGRGFENDYKRPADSGFGSGYTILTSKVIDPDSIQKVIDGRYLTVSVGQSTDKAICSICGDDWFKNGCDHWPGRTYTVGEGKKAKEFKCYIITGNLIPRELSFVNVPAYPKGKVVEWEEIVDCQDSNEPHLSTSQTVEKGVSSMLLVDAKGSTELIAGVKMAKKAEGKVFVEMPGVTDEELVDETEVIQDKEPDDKTNSESNDESVTQDDDKTLEKSNTPEPTEETDIDDKEEPASSEESDEGASRDSDVVLSDEEFALAHVAQSIQRAGHYLNDSSEELSKRNLDGRTDRFKSEEVKDHYHYSVMKVTEHGALGHTYATIGDDVVDHEHIIEGADIKDAAVAGETRSAIPGSKSGLAGPDHIHSFRIGYVDNTPSNDELETLVKRLEGELSDEQKEALKSDEFCGPNRSFPIASVDHVTAACRLITRYKGNAAAKARILNTIAKKAEKLGFSDSADEGEKEKEGKPTAPPEKTPDSDDSNATFTLEDLTSQLSQLGKLQQDLVTQTTAVSEKEERIKALTDALTAEKASHAKDLAMTLVISRIILRKKDTVAIDGTDAFVSLVDEFASRSIDSLKDAIIDFLPELDIAVRNANGRIHKSILIPSDEQSGEKTVKHQDITNDRQVGKRRTAPKPKGYRETAGAESLAVDIEISSRQER